MNYKTLHVCIVGLAVSSLAIGMEIKRPSLMAASKLGNIRLFHKDNGFVVERDGEKKNIQSCWVSPIIRGTSPDRLRKFLVADGYLRLNELKDANGSIDYKLDACGRLNGGGFVLAAVGTFSVAVAGAVATCGAAAGGFVVGGPAGAVAAAGATAIAAKAAIVYTAIALTATPTP